MLDGTILHLLNVFTRERIHLPSLESVDGSEVIVMKMNNHVFYGTLDYKAKPCRKLSYVMTNIGIHKAVLWIDEQNKDYLVVRSNDTFLAYHKRGDNNNSESWKVFEPLKSKDYIDMVLKERKLYVLRITGVVTVFDFSSGDDSPIECASFPPLDNTFLFYSSNLALTSSGEVLVISEIGGCYREIYKMDTKSSEWRIVKSIGDETWLCDLGITVATEGGVMKNCIYFSKDKLRLYNRLNDYKHNFKAYDGICVYDIVTEKVFKLFEHLTDSSSICFKDARWFFPTF